MPKKNMPKGSIVYKGYISPSCGKRLTTTGCKELAKRYSGCRHKNTGEIAERKTKCSKIAWSIVNKKRSNFKKKK